MKFNQSQKQAIHTTDGRLLVLAGAGSGKTSVLIARIIHLIESKGVSPDDIVGLTFTNKAAGEMRERITKQLNAARAKAVTLSTFHSFCVKILRKEIHRLGYTAQFTIYDQRDMDRLVERIEEENGDVKTAMRACNAVDFDSLLTLTVELFETYPEVLETYQPRYLMIDEFQDTNEIQCRLAELLAKKHNNLCVVGDDDQSIYAWRGAQVKNILSFAADTTVKLEENYRSTPLILQAANSVIKHNTERHDKSLKTTKGVGDKVTVFHAPTDAEEAQAVIDKILEIKANTKCRWRDFAILYRSNALARPLEIALIQAMHNTDGSWKRGIPYQVFGGLELFERSEIKDLMAYLRVIANPKDQQALLRIVNFPRRGISQTTLDRLTQYNRQKRLPLIHAMRTPPDTISPQGVKGLAAFIELIEEAKVQFEQGPLHKALDWLIRRINFTKAVTDDVKSEKGQEIKRQNVQECIYLLKAYEEEEDSPSLVDFVGSSMLDTTNNRKDKTLKDKVTLMTFHGAKGLEFPTCFLVGLEDHIIPHERSDTPEGIEEERRLLYVAITRAQQRLFLSMARKRMSYGKERPTSPSRFLFEIPKDVLQITK